MQRVSDLIDMEELTPPPAGGDCPCTPTQEHLSQGDSTLPCRTRSLRVRYDHATWLEPYLVDWVHRPHLPLVGTGYSCLWNKLSDDIIKAKLTELSSGSKPVLFHEALADVKRTSALPLLNPTHECAFSCSKPAMWSIASVVVEI